MKTYPPHSIRPNRRSFLKGVLAAGIAPLILPSRVLGLNGQTAPSKKITVGIIGAGNQGRGNMLNLLGQDGVRVVALCDVNRLNLDRARTQIAEAYGSSDAKEFTDFRQLNADPTIDAVVMALPVHWHALPSIDAVMRGKHIYFEKPVALSLEEGQRVRAAVKKKGVVFQFGTQQRSDTKFRWACELALNGRLGKLREIEVCAPGGKPGPVYPEAPVPETLDWDRWVGPATMTPFNSAKLARGNHENIRAFSLGMISCWGIHHLDIAQWGNGADATGPSSVSATGEFAPSGDHDAIMRWKVRYEYAEHAPMTFVSEPTEGIRHGVRFVGETGWVYARRGIIEASDEALLRDPRNRPGTMPIALPVSSEHTRNFIEAIRDGKRALCDVDTAVRSDTLCQLGLIAVSRGETLRWDPKRELFLDNPAADALLKAPAYRGEWTLPVV